MSYARSVILQLVLRHRVGFQSVWLAYEHPLVRAMGPIIATQMFCDVVRPTH